MNAQLKTKLDAAMKRFRDSYPPFTGNEGVAQTKARMERAKKRLPVILKTFSDDEIEELRNRLKEIDPGTIPTSHRANTNADVESTPYEFGYEYYFLSNLLK